jgi:hypothetical protein
MLISDNVYLKKCNKNVCYMCIHKEKETDSVFEQIEISIAKQKRVF